MEQNLLHRLPYLVFRWWSPVHRRGHPLAHFTSFFRRRTIWPFCLHSLPTALINQPHDYATGILPAQVFTVTLRCVQKEP